MGFYIYDKYSPTHLLVKSNGEDISFNELSHTYQVVLDKLTCHPPSVTQVLNRVFGDKYANVKYEKLLKAQEKGKIVHNEIKDFLVNGTLGVSPECDTIIQHIKCIHSPKDCCACEQYVYANTPYGMYAGTVDNFWLMQNLVVDYKTSIKLDKDNTKRQLNMYCYALRHMKTHWVVNDLEAWHIVGNKLKVVPFGIEPDIYVETIMRAYHDGKTFKNDKEMMDYYHKSDSFEEEKTYEEEKEYDDSFKKDCAKIAQVDDLISQLKNTREKLAVRIKEHLERRNLSDFQTQGMNIVYIPETEKQTFDVSSFKESNPHTYNSYLKKSIVKAHIRISYAKEK